ncbi:recombinase family protein [Frankia sp. CIT1]|uniref:recombinase family protein n=1 Tax=Frankia sp. CIT1 TaxID=2880974 RepID=UPI001EF5AEF9|nr:recombinase family protein [Frankia sp. CIT1]
MGNPPPVPIGEGRAVGRWTYSNVRDVVTNPKYTGHMVWNRRARKGNGKNRLNPVGEWVWSPVPVHEALVDLESFVLAQQVGLRRERSRTASGVNRHPQSRRVYRLRSYLFCALCGRRMLGKSVRDTPTTCVRRRRATTRRDIQPSPVSGSGRRRCLPVSAVSSRSVSSATTGVISSVPS